MTHIFTVHVKLRVSLLMDIFSSENNFLKAHRLVFIIIFLVNFFPEKHRYKIKRYLVLSLSSFLLFLMFG